ncbi:MAG TPA: hypothetical protein VFR85_18940 [Anaeromyxobacteraceae bacterium]|nr:hypothetical protein [Anaeromyxobacteraceae bacterium]
MRLANQTAAAIAPEPGLARAARRLALVASAAVALATATAAPAQELDLAAARTTRPGIAEPRASVEQAFLGEIGYRHVFGWGDQGLFEEDVALPWARVELGEHRVRAVADLPFGDRRWKLAGWLSPTVRGALNAASELTALGADLRLAAGHYARGWFVALEAGLDCIAFTHVTLGDPGRRAPRPGAGDGWYRTPGGTAYAGLQGGASFPSFDLILRAGSARTTALEPQRAPLYLTVGVNLTL